MTTQNRPKWALTLLAWGFISITTASAASSQSAGEVPVEERAERSAAAELKAAVAKLDPAAAGRLIFTEADARDEGYVDLSVDLRMVLKNARGRATERALRIRQLEVADDGDKVLVVFDAPGNIRGTALLSHAHPSTPDDQWLFLPALKRTKKIASRNRSGPFVGSEFSFEDLSPREIDKYTYEFLGIEACGALECFVVNRTPLDEYSGYTLQRVALDVEHLRVQQIDFTDRRNQPYKQLKVTGYELFKQRFWRPSFMHMSNLRTKKTTELHWDNYQFEVGFEADRDFSVNSLRRIR